MRYSFTCPIAGCAHVMSVDAQSESEAVDKLSEVAADHLKDTHPELKKTDEQIRDDVRSNLVQEDK